MRQGLRWAMRVAVTAVLVAWIVRTVDLRAVGRAITRVRPGTFTAGLALYVAGQALSAWKWALLGRAVGFEQSLADYTRFYFIGMFVNLLGPSTVGGDLARGLYLAGGRRPGVALNSVLFDRVSGLSILMGLGALALVCFPGYGLPAPLVGLMVAGGAALAAGWWTCPRLVRLLPAGHRVRVLVETDLAPFWRDRVMLGRVAAVTVVTHLSQVGVQWLLVDAAGTRLPLSYCLVFHPVISVLTALPVSLSGFGVREGSYLYFLVRMGIPASQALTVSLLWFAATVFGGLLGGVLFVAAGATLPRLRRPEPIS
jgi:uncharacterized membrane protein YbhN (UPF0104 family)